MAIKKKVKILEFIKDSALKGIVEKEHFIYDKAALYCVRDGCTGCKYLDTCVFDEESELEAYLNKSTRNNIKFGVPVDLNEWYLPNITKLGDLEYFKLSNGRYVPKVPTEKIPDNLKKQMVLSDSFKNVYKKVISIKDHDLTKLSEFIVFHPEELSYFCIKPSCKECEYFSKCNNELIEKERKLLYVAVDSSAQEPMIVTYLSREPEYIKIFTNHSIVGKIEYVLEPLEWLFETHYRVKTKDNPEYFSFIDYLAFEDKTILYNFSASVYEYIAGSLEVEDLEDEVSKIDKVWSDFKSKVKKGEIIFHEIHR